MDISQAREESAFEEEKSEDKGNGEYASEGEGGPIETEFKRVMRRLSSVDYGRFSFDESVVPLVRFESMPSKVVVEETNENYPFLEMRAHLRRMAMEERY